VAKTRILIYTGKGGVGKTSVSVATAMKTARMGKRTIVMSTDSAHSLSDSVEMTVGPDIKQISQNLYGLEIDILKELEENWNEIRTYVFALFSSQGMDEISAKEMTVFPGMEFIAALFYIYRFVNTGEFDVVVMDTAPTADTLRLLSFPDVADWYFQRFYGLMKNFIRVARATVGKVISFPLPSDEAMLEFEKFNLRIREVREILSDPSITSVRLVTNPEKMVISETMRAYTYLSLYGLNVEAIIVNRLYTSETAPSQEKMKEQEQYLKMIKENFQPLRIFHSHQFPVEVVGLKSAVRLGEELFGSEDPCSVYSMENPLRISSKGRKTTISIKVPFATLENLQLFTTRDSLIVDVGQYRRTVALPLGLYGREIDTAEIAEGVLTIRFREEKNAGKGRRRRD